MSAIVHMAGQGVLEDDQYRLWMSSFGENTQVHLMDDHLSDSLAHYLLRGILCPLSDHHFIGQASAKAQPIG